MKRTAVIALVVVCMMFGVVAYATAAAQPASGSVAVSASANPKIEISLSDPSINFGSVDPGVATPAIPIRETITVSSNKVWDLSIGFGGNAAIGSNTMGLTTTLAAFTNGAKGFGNTYVDDYQVNVPYTTAAGALSGTVSYTATQQ